MHRKLTAFVAMAIGLASLAGCGDTQESKAANRSATDKCFVDAIGGKGDATVYVKRGTVMVSGWAVDTQKQASPTELRLRLTGAQGAPHTFEKPAQVDRPDIVKAFNNEKLLKTGFNFTVDLSGLDTGAYGIILEMPDGSSLLMCQPKKIMVVQ
ncbi:hypothetical protein [Pseudomonas viridiflava]|uniref:Lipoprotein n=1 Tax=Pseudomonas viridiflava TaxID=33069 RepID=A0ABU7NE78_PSEVI|nr:hypothetical protein [Pseudomonas viridiflava]MBI6576832.1 hypothetical protein [Pseudomonas viridiflava]MBI6606417.1 hypothetical protein [Pseudomonas viridiflava]MBI6637501.1 hypothetical protein [Pseudomonas viridiflava]MBI6868733.1 hypothetical protein [Pseudomonas viridiflava]MDY0918288.1 hypothetical protein [Pseudomonas viridiflava]